MLPSRVESEGSNAPFASRDDYLVRVGVGKCNHFSERPTLLIGACLASGMIAQLAAQCLA